MWQHLLRQHKEGVAPVRQRHPAQVLRSRWTGATPLALLCLAGGCAADPTGPQSAASPRAAVVATESATPSSAASASVVSGSDTAQRRDYLYVLIALGTDDRVEETALRSLRAARDAASALNASLRGQYELSIDDGGLVTLPLSEDELRTFRESAEDGPRQDGLRGLDLYMEKLGVALDSIGDHRLTRYDGVVATVLLDMPDAQIWLSPAAGTGGIYLPETAYAQFSRTVDVISEIITDATSATARESTRVLAHEIGHGLGLGHAGIAQCHEPTPVPWDGALPVALTTGECFAEEYGDMTNIMGRAPVDGTTPTGELLNALQLHAIGALPAEALLDLAAAGRWDTTYTVELHALSSPEPGVRLIALPAAEDMHIRFTSDGGSEDENDVRPYLVLSPEYADEIRGHGRTPFTHHSLKVILAPASDDGSIPAMAAVRAVPLSRESENFLQPEDIGAPADHTGSVFTDAAGNTVSILGGTSRDTVSVRVVVRGSDPAD